jgi:hypothetical protein
MLLQSRKFRLPAKLVLILTFAVAGCSASPPYPREYSAPAAAAGSDNAGAKTDNPILGVWDGTTLASCGMQSLPNRCNAQQLVKITLVEGPDSKVGGYYQCAYGNMNCYHLNETGKVVDAGMNGQLLSMRVMMNDGTSCRFNGRVNDNAVLGGYSCYTGASQFEEGTWRAKHSY